MNQNNQSTDKKNTSKNTKKRFFILVIGIIGIVGLAIVIFSIKNTSSSKDNKNNQPTKTPPIPPYQEEHDDCPYNEKSLTTFSKHNYERANEEDLAKWRKTPRVYAVKLWKKGYHWMDIIQLWEWQIPEAEIPDLATRQRIGVINGLLYMPNPQMYDENLNTEEKLKIAETNSFVGRAQDLIVIVRRVPTGGKINIHKKFGFGDEDERSDRGQVRKMVNFALQQENINPQQCKVSILWTIGAQRFGNEWDVNIGNSHGSSGGSAIYLALLSSLHRKPISRRVAATGTLIMQEQKGIVNSQEIVLPPGTNLPIAGLKEKTMACAEKEINRLVLSKYQTSPNLLVEKDESNPSINLTFEDYQTVIPPEIKEKMTAYWTENITELRKLLLGGKLS